MLRIAALLLLSVAVFAARADDCEAVSARVLEALKARDYTGAAGRFGGEMAAAFPASKLQALMADLEGKLGPLERFGAPGRTQGGGVGLATVPMHFRAGTLESRIACDAQGRVIGWRIVPAPVGATSQAGARDDAPYVQSPTFNEEAIVVGPARLPGRFSLPRKSGPHTAVVLLHGSGPQDMDQTLGPNKPFADLARGLATRGIAVLRYDKRTRARPEMFGKGDFTVEDEVLADAAAAVEQLRARPDVDPARVFVLGHSLGAAFAPLLATRSAVRGFILLAAPATHFEKMVVRQVRYIAALDGAVSDDEKAAIAQVEKGARQMEQLRAGRVATGPLPLGLPESYARDLLRTDPIALVRAMSQPVFVLQGERDYQVTMQDDLRLWKAAFERNPRVTLRTYPALNHLFHAGSGASGPAEYGRKGHVDEAVVRDIAEWVDRN